MLSPPTLRLFRLFAALLLAIIGLQAVPAAMADAPDRAPIHGSAFSSGTAEVAVLGLRRDGGVQIHAAAEPHFGPPPALAGAFIAAALALAGRISSAPPFRAAASASPPSRPARPANTRPRAPPIA